MLEVTSTQSTRLPPARGINTSYLPGVCKLQLLTNVVNLLSKTKPSRISPLFEESRLALSLPDNYEPNHPPYFNVARIYLAKGSRSTPERRRYVERIIKLYPEAQVVECLNTPHNRIELNETDALALHRRGKQTLVFGELKNAIRFSEEEGNTCLNYWHSSPYGFCPYGCKYCYLAGTQGVQFSPTVKIYINLPEMLAEIDFIARRLRKPTAFYVGKLQDALALDSLTAYSTVMIPFFAEHLCPPDIAYQEQ